MGTPSLLLVRESIKMVYIIRLSIIAITMCLVAASVEEGQSDHGKVIGGRFVQTLVVDDNQKDGNELKGGQNNFLPFGGRPIGNQKDGSELKGGLVVAFCSDTWSSL